MNYSGTQINVWGGAPPNGWPGMNANGGAVTFGTPNPNPFTTQYGYLTENMIQVCTQKRVGSLITILITYK